MSGPIDRLPAGAPSADRPALDPPADPDAPPPVRGGPAPHSLGRVSLRGFSAPVGVYGIAS